MVIGGIEALLLFFVGIAPAFLVRYKVLSRPIKWYTALAIVIPLWFLIAIVGVEIAADVFAVNALALHRQLGVLLHAIFFASAFILLHKGKNPRGTA
jgi:uncharacterized membrane protein YeiB